jgi:hypothetical protein
MSTKNPAEIARKLSSDIDDERRITMKTRNGISITVLTLAISGCATSGLPTETNCNDREVTLNHRAGSLDAHPEYVSLCSGNLLTIKIVPPVGLGDAETKDDPSNPVSASWLAKKNTNGDRIVIEVPRLPKKKTGITYKYSITIEGVGTLDPRAHIKR